MSDTVEPITLGEREVLSVGNINHKSRFHLVHDGQKYIDWEGACDAYEAALSASEAREKRLQAELDALNDDGALHTAYLSGQQDAKERISALEQREKKLREALEPFARLCQIGEPFSQNGNREVYGRNGTVLTSDDFRRARQALGE